MQIGALVGSGAETDAVCTDPPVPPQVGSEKIMNEMNQIALQMLATVLAIRKNGLQPKL